MRVYITGLSGMLGAAIGQLHKAHGDDVAGCDIRPPGQSINGARHIDIRKLEDLSEHMREFKPDRVYHCAAMLGVRNTEEYPEVCNQINVHGTANVVYASAMADADQIVFLSSSEVYGGGSDLHEESPLNGDNVYALGKAMGETLMRQIKSMDYRICRMFNCYGPRQARQFFISKSIERARTGQPIYLYGDAENAFRSYLYSNDAAALIKQVASDKHSSRMTVNVAHPDRHSLMDVAQTIRSVLGSADIQVLENNYLDRSKGRDVPTRTADTGRLHSIAPYYKPRSLEQGIRQLNQYWGSTIPDWEYPRRLL